MKRAVMVTIFTAACCLLLRAQNKTPASPPQTSAQAPASSPSAGETPAALARKFVEVWNTGDMAAINSFPAFTMHNHGGRVVAGPEMLGRVVKAWRTSMPDLVFTIDDTVAQGDLVAMRLTIKGTYKERLFPDTADPVSPPRPIRVTAMMMFRVKDGKIQDVWQEIDESVMRAEMGGPRQKKDDSASDDAGSHTKPAPAGELAPEKNPSRNP